MPLSTYTQGVFSFLHTSQIDALYTVYSSTQIKGFFDSQAAELKANHNGVITVLGQTTAGDSGAENIGSAAISGVTGTTVYAQLSNIYTQMLGIVLGQIVDGSLTDAKLSNTAGQIKDTVAAHLVDNKTAHEELQTIATATGTIDLSMSTANGFDVTLTGNTTFTFSNPPITGNVFAFTLYINQGATPKTITWPASVKWGNDTIPDLSTASKTSILVFVTKDGGTRWNGAMVNNKYTT